MIACKQYYLDINYRKHLVKKSHKSIDKSWDIRLRYPLSQISLIMEKQNMTKKNLKPQQAAPVQREINTTSSVGGTGLTPLWDSDSAIIPFAGDDAE